MSRETEVKQALDQVAGYLALGQARNARILLDATVASLLAAPRTDRLTGLLVEALAVQTFIKTELDTLGPVHTRPGFSYADRRRPWATLLDHVFVYSGRKGPGA